MYINPQVSGSAKMVGMPSHTPPADCRLAHNLHRAPRFRCRRQGGDSQCGECASDLAPSEAARVAPGSSVDAETPPAGTSQGSGPKNAPAAIVGQI